MRVLFLTHRLPYAPNRGDRIRAHHLLRSLAGFAEVDLVSLVHDRAEEARAGDLAGLATRVAVARVPRLGKLVRAGLALPTARPLTHVLLDSCAYRRATAEVVAARPPDVVLAFCSSMARFALEPPLDRFPLVLDMVDVDSAKWRLLARDARPPRRWIFAREARLLAQFEAFAARRAYVTLVVNARERDALERVAPGADALVVPNGVDLESFADRSPRPKEPRVAFCGVLDYAPNERGALWLAREVWPIVRSARPDARLLLVGANPTRAVRALADADATIEVTGTVPDVRPHLWRSAVAAAPLAVSMGIQNKVLEAIAAGLPCVVTPAVADGLPAEVLPACAVAGAPRAFADALLALLLEDDGARRARVESASLRGLAWAERLAPLRPVIEAAARRVPRAAPAAAPVRAEPTTMAGRPASGDAEPRPEHEHRSEPV